MEKISEDKMWIVRGALEILKALRYDTSGDVHKQFVERINSQYGHQLKYKEKKRSKKDRPSEN